MSLRKEFVELAMAEGQSIRELCRRFGISPPTAYKWLSTYQQEGERGLEDRSRRPRRSPSRTVPGIEEKVLEQRRANSDWGGRKISTVLRNKGCEEVPAPSTITGILRRNGLISPHEADKHRPFIRFEHEHPNSLWQMDFKGHIPVDGGRCHPLTVLDDHSRFALAVEACADERGETVKARLTSVFRRYGMPVRMLMDNGSPWGNDLHHPHTPFTTWLMRLGVRVSQGRPYHPQTQGKDERFHRTLLSGAIRGRVLVDLSSCQRSFDRFRHTYNHVRPHEGINMARPADRYRISPRRFPEELPAIEYDDGVETRSVSGREVSFRGRRVVLGRAFAGYRLGFVPTWVDGVWQVLFGVNRIGEADLRVSSSGPIRCVNHVSGPYSGRGLG